MTTFPYLQIDDRVPTIDTWADFDQAYLKPTYSIAKRTENNNPLVRLGDGYQSSFAFGLNTVRPEWDIQFSVNAQEADELEVFFVKYCTEESNVFDWIPPDSSISSKWRIDEWSASQETHNRITYKTTLRRVFDLIYPSVLAIPVDCSEDDNLCGIDYEQFNGFADAWLARLDGSLNSGQAYASYGGNSWVSETGHIYIVYTLSYVATPPESNTKLYLTKLEPNGKKVWTYNYNVYDKINTNRAQYIWGIGGDDVNGHIYVYARVTQGIANNYVYGFGNANLFMIFDQSNGTMKAARARSVGSNTNSGCQMNLGPQTGIATGFLQYEPANNTVKTYSCGYTNIWDASTGNPIVEGSAGTWGQPGKLGNQDYSVQFGYTGNTELYLMPGIATYTTSLTTYYRIKSSDTSSTSNIVQNLIFLGNGQALAWAYPQNSGYYELMLIGLNSSTLQPYVVDQIRVLNGLPYVGNWLGWPYITSAAYDVTQQGATTSAFLDKINKKIYLQSAGYFGPSCSEIGVNMVDGQITELLGRTGYSYMTSGGSPYRIASTKQSASSAQLKRVVSAGGSQTNEIGAMAINRRINTNGANIVVNAGGVGSTTFGASYTINGAINQTPSISRSGLKLLFQGPFTTGQGYYTVLAQCNAPSSQAYAANLLPVFNEKTLVNDNWSLYPITM
jgi:phage-related protein